MQNDRNGVRHGKLSHSAAVRLGIAAVVFAVAIAFLLNFTVDALAATGGAERAGKNIGDILSSIGGYILVPLVGIIGLGLLAGRKLAQLVPLLAIAFVIGAFVFAPNQMAGLIKATTKAITQGT